MEYTKSVGDDENVSYILFPIVSSGLPVVPLLFVKGQPNTPSENIRWGTCHFTSKLFLHLSNNSMSGAAISVFTLSSFGRPSL